MIIKSSDALVQGLIAVFERERMLTRVEIEALRKNFAQSGQELFESFLIEENILPKEQLLTALQLYYDRPSIDVSGIFFDHHLLRMFDKDVMLRNGFIPYEHDGDILIVIAGNPNDIQLSEIIGSYVSYDVTYMVGLVRDIQDAVKEFFDESLTISESEEYDREDALRMQHPVDTFPQEDE